LNYVTNFKTAPRVHAMPVEHMTTHGGLLLVLAVLVRLSGCWPDWFWADAMPRKSPSDFATGLWLAIAIADLLQIRRYPGLSSGWLVPPLGIALRADGLAAVMLVATAW
jgi:hypothetical protein